MECEHCDNKTKEPIGCQQCGNMYCPGCQPYWDYTSDICQFCQERNSIAALQEADFTSRLRQQFNAEAVVPVIPIMPGMELPWHVVQKPSNQWLAYNDASPCWMLYSGATPVAVFMSEPAAGWACRAVNAHHGLAAAAATVYNRIREGRPFWNGSREDCLLWNKIKEFIT